MPQITVEQAFQSAVQHHQAGQLGQAENLYRQILARFPNHVDAMHMLGILAHQVGRSEVAVDLIRRAMSLGLNTPQAHSNLGNALRQKGELDAAIAACRQAIALGPKLPEAHANLGNALCDKGLLDQAIAAYRQAIALRPNYSEAQNNLGTALKNAGRLDEAIAAYRQAISLRPDSPEAYNNLGNALNDKGQLDEAIAACRQAIALRPNYPEAHNNLGIALAASGQLDEALACFRQAVALNPNYATAYSNLGNALFERGELDPAVAAYRQAIALWPNYADAYSNLGNAMSARGQLDEAIASFRQAIALKPGFVDAHYNLANAWIKKGELDEAVAAYRRVIALDPGRLEAHNNLGNVMKDTGRLDEALACYRRAMELNPQRPAAHDNLVYSLYFHPGYDTRAIYQEHVKWDERHGEPLRKFIQPHSNVRDPDRGLKIGYVSADFRDHVVGRNLLPLIREHNRAGFEVICYADVKEPDGTTKKFRSYADGWREIVALSDEELAKQIRRDGIDLLIDCTLHMSGGRLPAFARKPAPVQVTAFGYPGTTGLSAMDYRLTDPGLDPPGAADADYTERSIRLPHSFWCYDPAATPDSTIDEFAVSALPALANKFVTFGCLNNFCKVNAEVLKLWAAVLRKVSGSKLLLLTPGGTARENTLAVLREEGIESARIEFITHTERDAYLKRYHRIDIGLDTFPYNGHTTSLDALWMGVPVVTLLGKTVVGRAGLSQLTNLGRPQWVAESQQQYVQIAADLAGDLPRLAETRAELRERMLESPLTDAKGFARDIEAAYRMMWREWCSARISESAE